jgi:hypothetical protein
MLAGAARGHGEDSMSDTKRTWTTLLLGLWLLGCGGGGAAEPDMAGASEATEGDEDSEAPAPNNVVRKTGSGSVEALLGAPGGSLELNDGPRVEIPPGAVEGSQEFVLKVAQKTTAFGNRESEKPVGPTFSIAPGIDAPEGRAVIVSIPTGAIPDGWGDPALGYEVEVGAIQHGEDSTRTKWQYETAKITGGRIVAELPGLTGLRMQFVLSNLEAQ